MSTMRRASVKGVAAQSMVIQPRRWLGRNYLRNLSVADKSWTERADAIAKGDQFSMLDILEQRGFVNQIVGTRDEFKKLLDQRRVGVYCGIDPTADSMHVGHMVPFMALSWMYIHGYAVTFLLGGATASIGDPEGRLTARSELGRADRLANVSALHFQLKRFGGTMESYAERRGYTREWAWKRRLMNNDLWHQKLPWLNLMQTMGQYVRLGPMLGRDSVKNRMEQGDGMSFSEFSYPLIQAWDWWHMYQRGTQVQIGGADQFGNILQGAEAVKLAAKNDAEWQERQAAIQDTYPEGRTAEDLVTEDPMGFTVPLLTTAKGEKFGKSAGNAIWLDSDKTSFFELYQFWLRTADADVERYLKLFTFLKLSEIEAVMHEHQKDESKRTAQHKLASEFTELIHGLDAAKKAEAEHRALFSKNLSLNEILATSKEKTPATEQEVDSPPQFAKNPSPESADKYSTVKAVLPRSAVMHKPMSAVLRAAGMVKTNAEGYRLIVSGGAYIGGSIADQSTRKLANNEALVYTKIGHSRWGWWKDFIIDDKLLILRVGKWRIKVIDIVSDHEFSSRGLTYPGYEADIADREAERAAKDASVSALNTNAGDIDHLVGELER